MNLKSTTSVLFALSLGIFISSCSFMGSCVQGEGKVIERTLTLESFSKVDVSGATTVFISQGETQTVTISAQENIIALLNKNVSGDEWEIEFERCIKSTEGIEIYITIPEIEELQINGSGSITSKGLLQSDKMKLDIQGSGELNLELDVKELETEIAGSGDITLKGTTKIHNIDVNGSGDVNAYDLRSDEDEIKINGSGDVKVNVSYSLSVKVNGSGDVYYKGDVKEISSSINGSGNLKQAE
jgi:hypothetical protein